MITKEKSLMEISAGLIDNVDQQMIVSVDGRDVIYEFTDLDELVLAYAVSIHKYQGSECPCVIIPCIPLILSSSIVIFCIQASQEASVLL